MISLNKIQSFLDTKGYSITTVYSSERAVYIDILHNTSALRTFIFTPKKTFQLDTNQPQVEIFEKPPPDITIQTDDPPPTFSFENAANIYSDITLERKDLKRAAAQALRLAKCHKTISIVVLIDNYLIHSNGSKVWPFLAPTINGPHRFFTAVNIKSIIEDLPLCHNVDNILRQRILSSRSHHDETFVKLLHTLETVTKTLSHTYSTCSALDNQVDDIASSLSSINDNVSSTQKSLSVCKDVVQRSLQKSYLEETLVHAVTLKKKLDNIDSQRRKKYLDIERTLYENTILLDTLLKNIESLKK